MTVHALDRAGEFDMPLAAGDRVRFFDRVGDGHQVIANNGDVCTVLTADKAGVTVHNERTSVQGRVAFDRILDVDTGTVRLGTGGRHDPTQVRALPSLRPFL